MSAPRQPWKPSKVLPHGPLVPLADGVWSVDGALPDMPIPRRMVIVRRADDSLLVHSAIAVNLAQLAGAPRLARVVMSHGTPITAGAADVLAALSGGAAS